jgi:hypothetical protein
MIFQKAMNNPRLVGAHHSPVRRSLGEGGVRAALLPRPSTPGPFPFEKLPNEPIFEKSICLQTQEIFDIGHSAAKKTNPFFPGLSTRTRRKRNEIVP